jgi:prepilin-type processing-associated H-X9-DG protein
MRHYGTNAPAYWKGVSYPSYIENISDATYVYRYYRLDIIAAPSQFVFVMDSFDYWNFMDKSQHPRYPTYLVGGGSSDSRAWLAHQLKMNCAYADGHTDSLTRSGLFDQAGPLSTYPY